MDKSDILRLFDLQVRAKPKATPGLEVVCGEGVVWLEGAYNFVCSWDLRNGDVKRVVATIADRFRKKGKALMWRVYGHDGPEELESTLRLEGFEAYPAGTLLAFDLSDSTLAAVEKADIREVGDEQGIHDYLSVAQAAFGSIEPGQFEYFQQLLPRDDFALFCGYVDDLPAVSGLMQLLPGSAFGQLFGGGVAPEHRGKGLYRATVAERAQYAKDRGFRYLTTEARDTSRPILESLGFVPLTTETTWVLNGKS